MRQYKKEKKGALKEIRKDRNFIARVKLSEQTKRYSLKVSHPFLVVGCSSISLLCYSCDFHLQGCRT